MRAAASDLLSQKGPAIVAMETGIGINAFTRPLPFIQQLWVKQRREGKYKIKKMIIPEAI
jgi:hypothetical protein